MKIPNGAGVQRCGPDGYHGFHGGADAGKFNSGRDIPGCPGHFAIARKEVWKGLACPVARGKTLRFSGFLLATLVLIATLALAGVNRWTSNGPEGGTVRALFDLSHPNGGPFPSDRFTVRDRSHLTGLRVNLPKPDCAERPSDCDAINVINTLDGFNLQPRRA